jgi:hypothetical protein
MRLTAALLIGGSLCLAACSNSTEFTQSVSGTLQAGQSFATGVDIALIPSTTGQRCTNPPVFATTASNGQLSGSRTALTGKFAVIVQHDTLCIRDAGVWRKAWSGTYGPAPRSAVFLCAKEALAWRCTLNGMSTQRE